VTGTDELYTRFWSHHRLCFAINKRYLTLTVAHFAINASKKHLFFQNTMKRNEIDDYSYR